jgi:hypothetical protein
VAAPAGAPARSISTAGREPLEAVLEEVRAFRRNARRASA